MIVEAVISGAGPSTSSATSRVSRLNGCKLPATNQGDHCGPSGTHRMTPGPRPAQLTDFQEHPGEISEPQPLEWTGGPWRKIA